MRDNIKNKGIEKLRVLISGGGTGGHIFPAIAIAQEIQTRISNAEFLFIGAEGKMEMEKVPQAGFRIEGLNISGFNRGNFFKNLGLPFKIISSLYKARKIIKNFNPDFAIGTGGFASAPALFVASRMGVPIFIQEQNSLPGKTNIFLSKRAKAVFTAYPEMQNFFGKTPTYFLGNPIRENIIADRIETDLAKEKLGLDKSKLTILSVGGSLGSKTINDVWEAYMDKIIEKDFQLIWQMGKQETAPQCTGNSQIVQSEFFNDMALVYSAADVIVSRAGAIAISELAVIQKPILLSPFPFAAEDHQTKNALALVSKNAAKMVKDSEMKDDFWKVLMEICEDENLRKEMTENIGYFAKPNATKEIVDKIFEKIENDK